MIRLGFALMWLLHFLPLAALARVGAGLGAILYAVAGARRRVVLTNLRLCFPELGEGERRQLARAHFRAFARSMLEHGVLWWGSKARIEAMVRLEGIENWLDIKDRPVILLAPHFIRLDTGGIPITCPGRRVDSVYTRQKNAAAHAIFMHGRTRVGQSGLFSRQDGIRPIVKSIK